MKICPSCARLNEDWNNICSNEHCTEYLAGVHIARQCPSCDGYSPPESSVCQSCDWDFPIEGAAAGSDVRQSDTDAAEVGTMAEAVVSVPVGQYPQAGPNVFERGSLVGDGLYELKEPIDRKGGQADLWECRPVGGSGNLAVAKIYEMAPRSSLGYYRKIRELDHPNILALLFADFEYGRFIEIAEFARGGTIQDQLDKGREYTVSELRGLVRQMNEALHQCHSESIVHGDVKPSNLFFKDSARTGLLLGDFGSVQELVDDRSRTSGGGARTFAYLAPELISTESERWYSKAGDYFALGKTILVMHLGKDPEEQDLTRMIIRHREGAWQEKLDQNEVPKEIQSLILGLLHPDETSRFGYTQVESWCDHESVTVPAYPKVGGQSGFAYEFLGHVVRNRKDLADWLCRYPHEAEKHLAGDPDRSILYQRITQEDSDLAVRIREALKALEESGSDADGAISPVLVAVAHTLDPERPFKLTDSREVFSPDEVLGVVEEGGVGSSEWVAARGHLRMGSFGAWLHARHQQTVGPNAGAENDAHPSLDYRQYEAYRGWCRKSGIPSSDSDRDLEFFLHFLDINLPYPRMAVEPETLNFGRMQWNDSREISLQIRNSDRGYLFGEILLEQRAVGLSLSQDSFSGPETTVHLRLETSEHRPGSRIKDEVVVVGVEGDKELGQRIPVTARVAFPSRRVLEAAFGWGALGALFASAWRAAVGYLSGQGLTGWVNPVGAATEPIVLLNAAVLAVLIGLGYLLRKRRG